MSGGGSAGTGPGGDAGTGPGRLSDEALIRVFAALPVLGFIVLGAAMFLIAAGVVR